MLHLIAENKGGRNFQINDGHDVNWRSVFRTSEDSLTSSVFGLLFYLPAELMWEIISEACYGDVLPKTAGKLINYEFWPRWTCEDVGYKEPDIFVEFEQFNFIIEAKRWERDQQNPSQWEEEIKAYKANYPDSNKPVYLLAIGGISEYDKASSTFSDVVILRCRWHNLLKQIKLHLKLLEQTNHISITNSLLNILKDLVLSFSIHSYVTGELLETMPTTKYKIGNSLETLLKFSFSQGLRIEKLA